MHTIWIAWLEIWKKKIDALHKSISLRPSASYDARTDRRYNLLNIVNIYN